MAEDGFGLVLTREDALELVLALIFSAGVLWWWFIWHPSRDRRRARRHTQSARYAMASASSLLIPRFDPYVRKGSVVYMATGDGCYVRRIKRSRAGTLRDTLRDWLDQRQAIVHLIITVPSEQARHEWLWLKEKCPGRFHLYFLHRDRVSGAAADKTKATIETLDTFHPLLLINPPNTTSSAMWIEGYHAVGSKYAYHVEFVCPADVAKDTRLDQYKHMYEDLLQGDHVEELVGVPPSDLRAA